MRSMTWLWLAAASCAVPMACTFGADDFKVVDASSGGDNVNGADLVVTAMADGRRAAEAIGNYLDRLR